MTITTPIFDFEKTIHSALYIAEKIEERDFHRFFKILYFADREHLSKYGRPITGDTYIKMEYGPVPTNLYNIFLSVKNNKRFQKKDMKEYFTVLDYHVNAEKKANLDFLSKTDVAELNKSIALYGTASFNELSSISHGIAWKLAKDNRKIAIENILLEAGEDNEYISYIVEDINFQKSLI